MLCYQNSNGWGGRGKKTGKTIVHSKTVVLILHESTFVITRQARVAGSCSHLDSYMERNHAGWVRLSLHSYCDWSQWDNFISMSVGVVGTNLYIKSHKTI